MFTYKVYNPRLPACPWVCSPPSRASAIGWVGPSFKVVAIARSRIRHGLGEIDRRMSAPAQYKLFGGMHYYGSQWQAPSLPSKNAL
jgi:hypothetical protein